MPLCQGLPNGPCPKSHNNALVHVGEGDLMLCVDFDNTRFQELQDSRNNGSSVAQSVVSEYMAVVNTDTVNVSDDATMRSSCPLKVDETEMKLNELFRLFVVMQRVARV